MQCIYHAILLTRGSRHIPDHQCLYGAQASVTHAQHRCRSSAGALTLTDLPVPQHRARIASAWVSGAYW